MFAVILTCQVFTLPHFILVRPCKNVIYGFQVTDKESDLERLKVPLVAWQIRGRAGLIQAPWLPGPCPLPPEVALGTLDANPRTFSITQFPWDPGWQTDARATMCCYVCTFLVSVSFVFLSIRPLLISSFPSWSSCLSSAWNRIPGWRIGVGKRATLGPGNS